MTFRDLTDGDPPDRLQKKEGGRVKVGDLVRGSEENLEVQQNSIALIVGEDPGGRFSIIWIGGEIKGDRILHNFQPYELEVISEGG